MVGAPGACGYSPDLRPLCAARMPQGTLNVPRLLEVLLEEAGLEEAYLKNNSNR